MSHTLKKLPLGEVATFRSGGTPSKSRPDYWGGEFPWVSAKDLKSPIVTDSLERLTAEGFASANIAPENSLLMLVRGMTLFKNVPVCLAGRDVAFNQDIKALVVSDAIVPKYLLYFLHSQKYKLLDLVDSAGHGTGRIDADLLKAFPVLIPSLPEQSAIANLLTSWDEAIEKTERLIVAKEKQKKALMQSLLTSNQRLKGFQESWAEFHLGEVFKERIERANNHLPLLSITREEGVIPRSEDRKDTSSEDKSNYLRICPGDIGYNTMRMWQGVSALSSLDGIVSPAYTICTPQKGVDGEFISYLFKLPRIINLFYRHSQGLTSDTWNLKYHHFQEIKVTIPVIEEQKAIARVLRVCDEELVLLKMQAESYRKQKRGLMQKLLIGEWRVKTGKEDI